MRHLVIVRTGASILDLKTYNCQELGLAKALTKKGWKVSLIMAGKEACVEEYLCEGGSVLVHFMKFIRLDQRFGYFIGIDGKLDELKPDILQVHDLGIFMTWYVTHWAKKHSVPCYLIQGTYSTSDRPVVRQIETLFCLTFGKYTLRNVAGIGCKTLMASRFLNRFSDRDTTLTCIGLDESKFSSPSNREWRNELNLGDRHVLLYVGALERRRRPHFLLDIIKELPDDYVLLLAGDGPQKVELEERIKNDKLNGKVHLLGKLEQELLPSLYGISDLFLLPSEYEIYGMAMLESMYFGLPLVSSNTAGSETVIDSYTDGVIVREFDTDKWCGTIECLCRDTVKLESMKSRAKSKIREKLVWDKAADSFASLYES